VRVLTWNLKHGRAVPGARGSLLEEFAGALAAWPWDVALLQEVPPWWAAPLARRAGAQWRRVLTSRNAGLPIRRALATRWPELMKSAGGGANAILIRGGDVLAHRTRRLCWWPERRWAQAVHVAGPAFGPSCWVANFHATAHDAAAAARDTARAATGVRSWADGSPCVLGGDFNLRRPYPEGFDHAGGHDVDHVFVCGWAADAEAAMLERGRLSDHAPVLVTVRGRGCAAPLPHQVLVRPPVSDMPDGM
jgi:endonuclease/exonuclease/phosphatase family metal-dependent hydrolase